MQPPRDTHSLQTSQNNNQRTQMSTVNMRRSCAQAWRHHAAGLRPLTRDTVSGVVCMAGVGCQSSSGRCRTQPHLASPLQILRQSSSTSRRCPICRKQLHDTSATAYPINITLLEVLDATDEADDDYSPRLVRMDNLGAHPSLASHASMAGSPPSSQHTDHVQTTLPPPPVHVRPLPEGSAGAASVDVSDEDAATRAAGEAAALLPWEGWLVQRAGVRLAAVGLLPALRAGRGTVPAMVWGRVVAKYRLPGAFVKKFVEDSARRIRAWIGDRAGLQEGRNRSLAIHCL